MNFDNLESPLAVLEEDPFAESKASQYSYKPRVDVMEVTKPVMEMEEKNDYQTALRKLPAVRALTNEIDISNPKTIQMFGAKAGDGISRVSSQLLDNTQAIRSKEISEMMVNLTNAMKRFDATELDLDDQMGKRGIFGKMRMKVKESIEDIVAKYDNLAKDVDKISATLNRYMSDIDSSNANLEKLYNANAQYFKALECYVVAADMGLEEIQDKMNEVQSDPSMSDDQKSFIVRKLQDNYYLLEQRKADLQTAEMVSLQLQPTLALMMQSNYQLMGKINTSFIVTLPVFKISLTNAVMLKRQEIQAKSIAQLDQATNDLLLRNANTTVNNSKTVAKMANTTGIKMETLQKVQDTIMNGINEVNETMAAASVQRKEDSKELNRMILDMKQKGFGA
ncbi:toxic anion resistance protein [Allobaculum mucilyticum]|uniref:toxic anion resistance protein n=1 Tax=Allobaculum mucilyticum TaxID=2834459 RepID=UPI001E500765|nr:toxic anion resistance protein [Allobaculum mucilyticum]UNT95488.1 toxic anion resistance protein [Allobaculum mucilyticum]